MEESTKTVPPQPLTAALCLASGSPRRADILRDAGMQFDIDPANVDESALLTDIAPAEYAARLASEKAKAVATRRPYSIVLAADTLVVVDGEILGKPADSIGAREMLERLRGRAHQVITGVAVLNGEKSAVDTETTSVYMRDYTSDEIERYIAGGSPLDKAGAYGIQDKPFSPASSISGCYLNVVGLPLCLTSRLLDSAGAPAGVYSSTCTAHNLIGGTT